MIFGAITAWVSSAAEDVSLLGHEYFPEFLVVTLLVLLVLTVKRLSSRGRRSLF